MINSLNNESREDILKEFDRLFCVQEQKSENPMAYRRKEKGERKKKDNKKSDEIILLPELIKTDEVIKKLGRSLGERYLLIISSFYSRGLLKKKVKKELGNYLAGHWKILRKIGGEKYSELIQVGLNNFQHLKKSPAPFIKGKRSYAYSLNEDTVDLTRQQRYTLTTVSSQNARRKHQIERRAEYVAKHEIYSKIASSVSELTFDYAAALKYVAGITDQSKRLHEQAVVEQLIAGDLVWAMDQQGRNYTVLVSVPRDLRVFFSWKKQPLWIVDVASSQPLLHSLLYPDDCYEKKKYLSAIKSGFWVFMRNASGVSCDLDDEEQKGAMKEQIFQQVFYSFREGKKGTTGIYAKAFQREFPLLWDYINAAKKEHGPKQSSGLSKTMMWIEAWAVFEAIKELKDKSYPLISIHDAIATTKEGVDDVISALAAAFLPANLEPKLVAKVLTADT
jgi:hypothetical protein